MLMGPNGWPLVLVIVVVNGPAVVPTATVPKSWLVGDAVIGFTPVPTKLTLKSSPSDCDAVSLMVKLEVSVNGPGPVGENE